MQFRFSTNQRTFKIGNVYVGRQPGERPPVLIGTIFYEGFKHVEDPLKGVFNKDKATELVVKQDELSRKTGIPCMIDVVGFTADALKRYVEFIADVTNAPILIDSSSTNARLEACKFAVEIGLVDRIIYSSITPMTTDEELNKIREIGIKNTLILAFHQDELLPEQKLELLVGKPNLLGKVEKIGIKGILIDVAVLDLVSVSYSISAIRFIKEKLGLPVGCAPSNAFYLWDRVKEFGSHVVRSCFAALSSFVQSAGADFILYGPIGMADVVFPICAMIDSIITYNEIVRGYKPKSDDVPIYKIF